MRPIRAAEKIVSKSSFVIISISYKLEGQVEDDLVFFGNKLAVRYPAGIHKTLGSDGAVSIRIFVGEVHDLLDARLDDLFGALVAGEEIHIDGSALEIAARTVIVEDGVALGMYYIQILRIEGLSLSRPGELVVGEAVGSAVVADGQNAVDGGHDACADLGIRVFGAAGG